MNEVTTLPERPPEVVALFGPTGLGKTAIAVELARRIGGEIVSADAMQVYRGLPILTNQPDPGQLAAVPHHLVAIVDPREEFSAAIYARLAHAAIDDIVAREHVPVLEGGSGLYLRAGLGGLAFGAPPDPALRAQLEAEWARDPAAPVARLHALDPRTAAVVDTDNPRRVLRALETVISQGRPLTPRQRDGLWTTTGARRPFRLFALDVDRARLKEAVDDRVEAMVRAGLVAEVAALPGGLSRTVKQAIGVEEILEHLAGRLTLEEATGRMKARTRRYVRRQLTWMRKTPDASIVATSGRSPAEVADDIAGRLP